MMLEPLRMRPCYKDYLWGGTRLRREFGKTDAPEVTAESWELASHAAGNSSPLLTGLDRSAYWGTDCASGEFPIMVKLIDAKQNLSVQVHPSDETANRAAGEQGKTEMWYIVDCAPQAFLYLGFSKKIGRREFLRRAGDGSILEVLNRVPVSKGDVFCIRPGTIHAIGAGSVIAEIQQNSNTTFRVYDYNRVGPDGRRREVHLDRAAEVVNYEPVVPSECRANNIVSFPEFQMREMFSCRYFRAWRLDVRKSVRLRCDGTSFQHLLCVEGRGDILAGKAIYPLTRGASYLMPAALGEYELRGECRVLLSRV